MGEYVYILTERKSVNRQSGDNDIKTIGFFNSKKEGITYIRKNYNAWGRKFFRGAPTDHVFTEDNFKKGIICFLIKEGDYKRDTFQLKRVKKIA